ncbi:MAG: hypothetical protein H0V33_11455, partial [Acidimicrobiia bacterium]|nr:hypothetical protein [Acidimicrobiia bacterium]
MREGLEEQEAFLVRSLVDLEREHDAGDLTDGHHAELRAEYEERLAGVRDALVGGGRVPSRRVGATGGRPRRRPLVVAGAGVGVVAFAVAAGLL